MRKSVDYLLVAEFDIDKGPTIKHQYPEPLGSDDKFERNENQENC